MRRPYIAEGAGWATSAIRSRVSVPRPATVSRKSPLRRNAMSAEPSRVSSPRSSISPERKRAEQARATLAAIVESSEDAIVSNDLHGIITSWNRGAERLYGYSQQEAVGRPVTMLVPEDLLDHEVPILERIARAKRSSSMKPSDEEKDGTRIHISRCRLFETMKARSWGCRKSPTILRSGSRRKPRYAKVKSACACLSSMRPRPSRCSTGNYGGRQPAVVVGIWFGRGRGGTISL